VAEIVFTDYARFEMQRRRIDEAQIRALLAHPQQSIPGRKGRIIVQGKYEDHVEGKEMLLRVITERVGKEVRIITAYKTSKIGKYWVEG